MPKILGACALGILILIAIVDWPRRTPTGPQSEAQTASVLVPAIVDFTNADRAARNVGAVTLDDKLSAVAQAKADDMAFHSYFAHVSPQGKSPWYWLEQADYKYSYAGENLAMDFADSHEVEQAWMNSPTHRDNVLKPQYTRIGVGISHGRYQGHETTYVVTFFAAPAK
jgi:uncharacterized protein YkwD